MTRALFLDRDGVINVDHGHVSRAEDFTFVDGIFDLVRTANTRGYEVVVITNQAGIARGFYSEAQFVSLMQWVSQQFIAQAARIDAVYYCPCHPDHGVAPYRADSEGRKPRPGMIRRAAAERGLLLAESVMVGDRVSDMQAGSTAGVGGLFLFNSSDAFPSATSISSLLTVQRYIEASSPGPSAAQASRAHEFVRVL
jgi:D-glycero-D-manno-heptose 1,7-bisphosphate phosphatase